MQPTNIRKKIYIRCTGTYVVLKTPSMLSFLAIFLNHILNDLKMLFVNRDHFQFHRDFNSIISVNSRIMNNLYVEAIPEIP